MKDSEFTPILLAIESQILAADKAAKAAGIELNDSQIRSILNKVRGATEGKSPKIPEGTPRDNALRTLHAELCKVRSKLVVEIYEDDSAEKVVVPLPLPAWLAGLKAIEDSIKTRSSGPGSREYLNFLDDFLEAA